MAVSMASLTSAGSVPGGGEVKCDSGVEGRGIAGHVPGIGGDESAEAGRRGKTVRSSKVTRP